MKKDPRAALKLMGSLDVKLLSPEHVAEETVKLLNPGTAPGTCLLIMQDGSVRRPFPRVPGSPRSSSSSSPSSSSSSSAAAGIKEPRDPWKRQAGLPAAETALMLQERRAMQQARAAWAACRPASYRKIQVTPPPPPPAGGRSSPRLE
jgi:hypothetical protein